MNKFRPFFAVFLLLALLCGCAAPHEVTTVSLPDAQPTTTLDSASTAAPVESTGGEFHYEYQTLPLPAPLLSATALTVLGDAILVGGFTEEGLALARMPLDGEAEALPLPDGAEYLYALGSDNEDGFWLLSGSLPGAYADGHGAVHFSESTTIGKLAAQLTKAGLKVWIGAADTFRAAAIDQLKVWADRAGATMIRQEMGSDPASVAFDTLTSAKANGADVVLIDTAGRLHNKVNLMNELTKIRNVMGKVIPGAPHEVMLVLDGSTGQNAFEQARQFTQATQVTSLTITKLDGTAKGGVVIGISDQFHIPVRYIGIGEGIDQLRIFDRREFVNALFGHETK